MCNFASNYTSMVKVSVILPIYNVAPYLNATFQSLIHQSLRDIEIIAVIDGYYEGQISEIEEPIEITIPLPNGLPKINSGYERIWKVIRYHNGATDVLDAKLTENGISFMNDKYSEFALVYEDVKLNVPEENTNVEETIEPEVITKNEEVVEASNPKTGDSIMIWISLSMIISTIIA